MGAVAAAVGIDTESYHSAAHVVGIGTIEATDFFASAAVLFLLVGPL